MDWQTRAEKVLLNNCCTMSKRVQSYVEGVYCSHVKSGDGNYLIMADESRKFDTGSGFGSNLWECKNNYSLECTESVELAEEILKRVQYHDKLKFVKTGSAACSAAIRYARAYTKRDRVAYVGYHGCDNIFVSCTPPALGTMYEMCQMFKSIETLTDFLEFLPGLAAVIVEPLELDTYGVKPRLAKLQAACKRDGCVLIYDEVITGWRVPGYTVANYTAVWPDISCFGKALGGTYSLGAVAFTKKIADATAGVFISNTNNGEQIVMRAALDVIKNTSYSDIKKMWRLSSVFRDTVNRIKPEWFTLRGYPARYVWECSSEDMKALIWQQAYEHGLLCSAAFFPKLSWTQKDFDKIIKILERSIDDIETGALLHGLPPRPFFKRV